MLWALVMILLIISSGTAMSPLAKGLKNIERRINNGGQLFPFAHNNPGQFVLDQIRNNIQKPHFSTFRDRFGWGDLNFKNVVNSDLAQQAIRNTFGILNETFGNFWPLPFGDFKNGYVSNFTTQKSQEEEYTEQSNYISTTTEDSGIINLRPEDIR